MPRGRRSLLSGMKLSYCCEWPNCSNTYDNEDLIKYHQLQHFKELCQQASQNSCPPICNICNALLDITDIDGIERHSFFHSWVSRLKTIGKHVLELNDWPVCLSDPMSCNLIPELPTKFECGWEYCDFKTNDVSIFITHVSKHPEEYTDSRYPANVQLKCLWENCKYMANRLRNLSCHLDTHTQTKRAACPTCGLLLVDFRKLEDHLKRQQVHLLNKSANFKEKLHHSIKPVKCSRCRKVFSTQRFLMMHMKRHINTVKCPFCDMTVWSKSALDRHILFRHSNEKPFFCPYCPFAFKIIDGLARHLKFKHKINGSNENGGTSINPVSLNTDQSDLDAERWPSHPTSVAPIHGPLAQAGALPLIQTDALTSADYDTTVFATPDVFVCPHNGCNFKTNKRNGYLVHIGRKHNPLPSNSSSESSDQPLNIDDSPKLSQDRLYICHMCSVVKRRGCELSKHLVKDHHLARPSGHVRFTYTISDDGHYRLQLTRLDTVRVAAQLLGETVVSKLLVDTRNQQLPICE
ncbi:hypothetical protein MN116_006158 [Schistosoma mekongi]|uniref:C2H2-type domain-containing protein n=1 Tax=Schistosoma mekongi TaxID=38744 RepID=A0AAE2D493_SCHME|nr:hypothetical protein MN116_006158 [Schistosoma mekongi]